MPEHICENAAERHEWRAAVWNSVAIASQGNTDRKSTGGRYPAVPARRAMKQDLVCAIADKRLVEFTYKAGRTRIVEPHDYGIRHGVECLLGFQIGGESQSGAPQGWNSSTSITSTSCTSWNVAVAWPSVQHALVEAAAPVLLCARAFAHKRGIHGAPVPFVPRPRDAGIDDPGRRQ